MKNILKYITGWVLGIMTTVLVVYIFRVYFAALLIYLIFKS